MLRLHTFGGVGVVDDHNEPLAGATDQRRPLAIVIAVAVSGRQGITRDKLASLLWPEVDPERARHSLTQSLYAARRAFQTDDLFQLDGSIRLNPARISSDVAEFSQAVRAGELENAVALCAQSLSQRHRGTGARRRPHGT